MSMYDNRLKDNLYDEIEYFLREYKDEESITALLNIVTDAIDRRIKNFI